MANDNLQESTSKKNEQKSVSLKEELRDLRESELAHLESEFENYKTFHPTTELPLGVH